MFLSWILAYFSLPIHSYTAGWLVTLALPFRIKWHWNSNPKYLWTWPCCTQGLWGWPSYYEVIRAGSTLNNYIIIKQHKSGSEVESCVRQVPCKDGGRTGSVYMKKGTQRMWLAKHQQWGEEPGSWFALTPRRRNRPSQHHDLRLWTPELRATNTWCLSPPAYDSVPIALGNWCTL